MNLCQTSKVTSPIQTHTMASTQGKRQRPWCLPSTPSPWGRTCPSGQPGLPLPVHSQSAPSLTHNTNWESHMQKLLWVLLTRAEWKPRFPAVWCLNPCGRLNWDLNLCIFSKGLRFYAVFPARLNTRCLTSKFDLQMQKVYFLIQ